jgi:MFS family permease
MLFAAGLVLIGLFISIERRVADPILPLSLFKNRVVTISNITGFLVGAVMMGAITYIPLFVQGVIGESPSRSGYILTPLMLGLIGSSIIAGRVLSRFTFRAMVLTGLSIVTAGFALMTTMNIQTTNITVILYMIITGIGLGLLMPTFTIAVQSTVAKEVRGVATSSTQFFRSMGGTIGVCMMGAIMSQQLVKLTNPQLLLSAEARAELAKQNLLDPMRQELSNAIHYVFITGLVIVALAILFGAMMGSARMKKESVERVIEV